MAAQELL